MRETWLYGCHELPPPPPPPPSSSLVVIVYLYGSHTICDGYFSLCLFLSPFSSSIDHDNQGVDCSRTSIVVVVVVVVGAIVIVVVVVVGALYTINDRWQQLRKVGNRPLWSSNPSFLTAAPPLVHSLFLLPCGGGGSRWWFGRRVFLVKARSHHW